MNLKASQCPASDINLEASRCPASDARQRRTPGSTDARTFICQTLSNAALNSSAHCRGGACWTCRCRGWSPTCGAMSKRRRPSWPSSGGVPLTFQPSLVSALCAARSQSDAFNLGSRTYHGSTANMKAFAMHAAKCWMRAFGRCGSCCSTTLGTTRISRLAPGGQTRMSWLPVMLPRGGCDPICSHLFSVRHLVYSYSCMYPGQWLQLQ